MKRFISIAAVLLLIARISLCNAQQSPRFYWIYSIVDRDAPIGGSTTLLYDSKGRPNIVYRGTEGRRIVKIARFDGVNWQIDEVDPDGTHRVAFALDNLDNPHIVYYHPNCKTLNYAAFNGEAWRYEVLDSGLHSGSCYTLSIQVDSDRKAHIIYEPRYSDSGKDQISYAFVDGDSVGIRDRIDEGLGKWNSIVLTDQELPAVAYWQGNDDLWFAQLQQEEWATENITPSGSPVSEGFYASMKRGSDQNFYIAYHSRSTGNLRFASGGPGSWTIEEITTLNGTTTFSTPNPLALDQEDNLYVAYHDMSEGDLKLAYKLDNDWLIETVDTVGVVGQHASIAINPDGMPAISYYDSTNGYLRLAVGSLTPPADSDMDGVPDYLELEFGTDHLDCDSDDDGLSDGEEDLNHTGLVEVYETDPRDADSDDDGIQDGTEAGRVSGVSPPSGILGTDMNRFVPDSDPGTTTNNLLFDTDGDGLSDGEEDINANGRVDSDEADPNNSDSDGDGLQDGLEVQRALSPIDVDSDDDGLADNDEDKNLNGVLEASETDPANPDTDGDGILDGIEIGITNPVPDPDGNGRLLGTNLALFLPDADPSTTTDPVRFDSDSDGLGDGEEDKDLNGRFDFGETDPLNADTDGDNIDDGKEKKLGTNPLDLDSDDDGLSDGVEDANGNGRVDIGETSPLLFDSDEDNLGDGLELSVTAGIQDPDGTGHLQGTDYGVFVGDLHAETSTDPFMWDTDSDGLSDGEEDINRNGFLETTETDPLNADTDSDGATDGDEIAFLTDPLNAADSPKLSVLLREDFSQNNLSSWQIVDEGNVEGPSVWTVFNNAVVQSSNIYGGVDHTGVDDPNKPGTYIRRGSTGWKDYKLSCKIRSDDDDALGIMFRFSGANDYYRFSMNREKQFARITRIFKGQPTILDKQAFEYEVGRWYSIDIYAVQSRLQFYLDGKRMFDIEDDKLSHGAFAFYSWRNVGSWFSDLVIKGGGVIVDVRAQIADFNYSSDERGRIVSWQILGDNYDAVKLERKNKRGNFERLLFKQKDDNNLDQSEFIFVDVEPWLAVGYRLTIMNSEGVLLDSLELIVDAEVIKDFTLSVPYPNPFYSQVNFTLSAPEPVEIKYQVFNIRGQLVRSDQFRHLNSGWHQIEWDGKDDRGRRASVGVYFIRIDFRRQGRIQQILKTLNEKVVKVQ